jgi:hypothetical protein
MIGSHNILSKNLSILEHLKNQMPIQQYYAKYTSIKQILNLFVEEE